jgi:hypothetical protein
MATSTQGKETAFKIRTRRPFKTYGSMFADTFASYGMGRLPQEWREDFYARADNINFVIYSYATPIAWHDTERGWVIPNVRYSQTSGRHQSAVRAALGGYFRQSYDYANVEKISYRETVETVPA